MSDSGPNAATLKLLAEIPAEFRDDGCSNSPDGFLLGISKVRGFRWLKRFARSFKRYCRLHDWSYCSRCHEPGTMNQHERSRADKRIGRNIRGCLSFGLRWWGWGYFKATSEFGGRRAWNSCGPASGERCRHNMPLPDWMAALGHLGGPSAAPEG